MTVQDLTAQVLETKTGSWNGDQTVRLPFPANWTVKHIRGRFLAAAGPEEMQEALDHPLGSAPLPQLLKNKKSVAIIVDDATRPTPVSSIVMKILEEIRGAGIPDHQVTVLVALGTHVLTDPSLLRSKYKGILDTSVRFILPDCRNSKDYVHVGQSKRNIPVFVHRHYAHADVKITVSGIYPHAEAGFSGGAKILIGALRLSTLSLFHQQFSASGRGRSIENPFRDELESFADLAGMDFSVNILMNHEKQVHRMWCGNFRTAFREAAAHAQDALAVTPQRDAHVVISNAYPLDTSLTVMTKSQWPFKYARKDAKCILMASPASLSDYRLRPCVTQGEWFREAIKSFLLPLPVRRGVNHLRNHRFRLKFAKNPPDMWKRYFVYFMPCTTMAPTEKPQAISSHAVFTSWDVLRNALNTSLPHEGEVKVAFYDFAPMHYSWENPEENPLKASD